MFSILLFVLSWAPTAPAVPSPSALGSGLTILFNNDLLGPQSPSAESGVILLTSQSFDAARAACAALGEQLWTADLHPPSIQPNLDYLTYLNKFPAEQQYWVASNSSNANVMTGRGQRLAASHHLQLPVLCTQTAPFSNATFQDPSLQWQVTVHSNDEYYTGFRDRVSFRFLGIRYAPEPERFTYSTPYGGSGENASATAYGSQCIQPGASGSEDCLFLNIFTPFLPAPGPSTDHLKPVMFWIHGGAFTGGTGSDPTFDGGNLASRGDVVLVTINYRLSTLGFLALNDGITNGNYGLADQINALEWVRKNIRDFGGDPNRITIFGQSAGAASVRALLGSPKAEGKFAAAIPQSNLGGVGYATTYSSYLTIEEEVALAGEGVLAATNCTNASSQVECLRAIPASTIQNLETEARYLVVDGTYLTTSELVLNASTAASLSKVHILQGYMRDDAAALISYVNTDNVTASLASNGLNTSTEDLFPNPDGSNSTLNVFNVTALDATDSEFRCIDQATAYAAISNHLFSGDQYFYEFNRSYQMAGWNPNAPVCDAPITAQYPNGDPSQEYFKCHSGDLFYVFGGVLRMGNPIRDEHDIPFEQFIVDSWTSFARTYNPNPDRALLKARGYTNTTLELDLAGTWLPVSKGGLEMRQLQWPSKQIGFQYVEQCATLGFPIDYYLN
ncbi:hypothetical protein B7494_g6314 [Chlorociboria aeruginascens]|nr:hypothetical protein B7494_g6314 [Chlorociboria aeruginascens]